MSKDGSSEQNPNKRKAESDSGEELETLKRGRFLTKPDDVDEPTCSSCVNPSKNTIEEAIKALDMIQYELNMGNILANSPDASDHDTPPESEDESANEESLDEAHALGFAACLRETFRFLVSCGVSENDPIFKQLKQRFVETSNWSRSLTDK